MGSSAPPIVELQRAGKRFSDQTLALDGIDLDVQPGELVGVVGAPGCGKSTLLRMVAGLTTPTSGVVAVRTRRIGFAFQDPLPLPEPPARAVARRARQRGAAWRAGWRAEGRAPAAGRRGDRHGRAGGVRRAPAAGPAGRDPRAGVAGRVAAAAARAAAARRALRGTRRAEPPPAQRRAGTALPGVALHRTAGHALGDRGGVPGEPRGRAGGPAWPGGRDLRGPVRPPEGAAAAPVRRLHPPRRRGLRVPPRRRHGPDRSGGAAVRPAPPPRPAGSRRRPRPWQAPGSWV